MGLLQKFSSDKTDPIQDIINNLRNILNIRKDFGSWVETLGIGDYNAYRSQHKVVETIIEEIKENIRLHEPRVKLMDIKRVESEVAFRLRFELRCALVNQSEQPIFIIFDSAYSKVTVEK